MMICSLLRTSFKNVVVVGFFFFLKVSIPRSLHPPMEVSLVSPFEICHQYHLLFIVIIIRKYTNK
jgi:hypothetical protein